LISFLLGHSNLLFHDENDFSLLDFRCSVVTLHP